ncbi:MAG: Trehalose synthase [Methanomassiliicoccales archaeon PtaU1.Bin030]|nr:MAG: Trehalose synthase [Methanomassiliicoccales archaeon PtaU1.Bin030]
MNPSVEKVIIPSSDDPFKGGGVGGKHTHIRLLASGLENLGVKVGTIYPHETVGFKLITRYPGALSRRLVTSKEKRVESWGQEKLELLRRSVRESDLDCQVLNPQDTLSLQVVASEMERRKVHIPMVLTVHGYYVREMVSAEGLDPTSPSVEKQLQEELSSYALASRIICVDSRIRDYISNQANIDRERMEVLPNAVDTLTFHPLPGPGMKALRRSLDVPGEAKILLCPRRLVPKNGVEFAIRAMAPITKKHPEAILLIAGDGPQRSHLHKVIADFGLEGHIILLGSVPHRTIPSYFQCSDIVLIPSTPSFGVEEATSLSMLEGMACGKPVIVSNIGGLKETITDGVNGFKVSAGDPDAIAERVIYIFDHKDVRESIALSGLEYVRKNHSHLVHAQKVLSQYKLAVRND